MKVKRYKRVQRILGFYGANFGLQPPFTAVADGTFLMAAKEGQVNLREQLPKYLCQKTELRTTGCVVAELEMLGAPVYAALHIARSLPQHQCGHAGQKSPQVPLSENEREIACLLSLAKAAAKGGAERVFLATQDPTLTDKLHSFPGTPILYIRREGLRSQTLLLEKPAAMSEAAAESAVEAKLGVAEADAARLKELKTAILGQTDEPKSGLRRKRRAKAPNPLSCLPKKRKPGSAAARKRKRKLKAAAQPTEP